MINILKKLLDFIYENNCYFCHSSKENSIFCSKCYNSVDFFQSKPFKKINGVELYAVTYYKDVTQKLIRAVKYHNKKDLAFYQAKLMYEYWKTLDIAGENFLVMPVPMFYSKARKRKYNHMDLVCEEFCKLTGYDYDLKSLIRNRETAPQYKLSSKEREKNLKNAFSVTKTELKQPILLIDDISTTGTTIKEILKVFEEKDITNVTTLVTAVPETPSNYVY